jgi:hypothetical protein
MLCKAARFRKAIQTIAASNCKRHSRSEPRSEREHSSRHIAG